MIDISITERIIDRYKNKTLYEKALAPFTVGLTPTTTGVNNIDEIVAWFGSIDDGNFILSLNYADTGTSRYVRMDYDKRYDYLYVISNFSTGTAHVTIRYTKTS